MCGLVGIAGDIRDSHKKMFRDMLVFDQVRGFDSTGICFVRLAHPAVSSQTALPGVEILKDLGAAQNLWEYDTDNKFGRRGVLNAAVKVLIGHNRAATIGKVTVDNAHPFNFGDVYGAHNGSLTVWKDLEGYTELDVDSKGIFNTIDLKGIDHTWKSFCGAAALTYWDDDDMTLNLVRNDERPLVTAWSDDGKTMFWASEAWMILAAASRNNIKLKYEGENKVACKSLPTDTLHKFKVTGISCKLEEERKLEKKPYLPTKKSSSGGIGFKVLGGHTKNEVVRFKPNKTWKRDTKRSPFLKKGEYKLIAFRKKEGESSFRANILTDTGLVGFLDVYPHNRAEFKTLERATHSTAELGYELDLRGSPRRAKELVYDKFPRWACSAALVKVEAKIINVSRNETEEKPTSNTEGNVLYLDQLVPGPTGMITMRALRQHISAAGGACAYCDDTLHPEDADFLFWMDKDRCLCPDCAKYSTNIYSMQ